MRQTKNIEEATNQYHRFASLVLLPTLTECHLTTFSKTYWPEPTKLTLRGIQKDYGYASSQVFARLFKLLKRGGYSKKASAGYPSVWVPNESAFAELHKWISSTTEFTSRSLLHSLKNSKFEELEFDKMTGMWVPKAMRAATMDEQRKKWVQAKRLLIQRSREELEKHNATYY